MKSIISKVIWVGRATVFCVGLPVMLALMLEIASPAPREQSCESVNLTQDKS
jgi:hypothetical protein